MDLHGSTVNQQAAHKMAVAQEKTTSQVPLSPLHSCGLPLHAQSLETKLKTKLRN